MNSNRGAPRSLSKNAEDLWRSAAWATRTAWLASSRILTAVAVTTLVRAFVPASLAITARGMVNAAIHGAGVSSPDLKPMIPWLILGFLFTLMDALSTATNNYARQRLRDDLNCHVTSQILEHAAKLEVSFFEDSHSQDLLKRANDDPATHITAFLLDVFSAVGSAIQIASLLAILLIMEPLVVVILLVFTLPYMRNQWALATQQYAIERTRTTKRRWTSYFVSLLTGSSNVGEVKLLRLAPLLLERFRTLMGEFRDQDGAMYSLGLKQASVFALLTTAAFYSVFLRVAWRVLQGVLTVGDLAIFGASTSRLRLTLEFFVVSTSRAMEHSLYVADTIEFLDLPVRPSAPRSGLAPVGRVGVELRDVTFMYPDSSVPALDRVSLTIAPGETIAVVGENGAGKTTLVKLIARLWDPTSGTIHFDGVDLRDIETEELQRRIAFVFQGFGRYEATAADNIAYGDWPTLLTDRARIQQVAKLAGVDKLIAGLPHGYDTSLGRTFGERDLSAGQWQKMAVARAFARNAALLILDEPTSSMDARAEYALFEQFQALAEGRTTIIVSHRFSTVSMADRIVVMEAGRIVESGTHRELLARAGNYASLYELHQRTRLKEAG